MSTKPWQNAHYGDLWVLKLDGDEEIRTATVERNLHSGIPYFVGDAIGTTLTDHHIVDGYRVYPPVVYTEDRYMLIAELLMKMKGKTWEEASDHEKLITIMNVSNLTDKLLYHDHPFLKPGEGHE